MEIASVYLSRKSSTAEARAKIPVRIPWSDPDTPKADSSGYSNPVLIR